MDIRQMQEHWEREHFSPYAHSAIPRWDEIYENLNAISEQYISVIRTGFFIANHSED